MKKTICAMLFLAAGAAFAQIGGSPKVVYGEDDRKDVFEVTDEQQLALAGSVFCIVPASLLQDNGDGTYTAITSDYTVGNRPACPGEPFADQPTWPSCSGVLVGDDIVATAGHCFTRASEIANFRYVFGFELLSPATPETVLDESQVYRPVEVIGRELAQSGFDDWAVLRLDREVTAPGAVPVPVRRTGTVPEGTLVGMIGYPWGLPKKIAFGANTVVKNNVPSTHFEANVDAFGGNSGSPVFNQVTGELEGLLVRGNQDFVIDGNCFRSNQLSDANGEGGRFEDVTKVTEFAELIPEEAEVVFGDVDGNDLVNAIDMQIIINTALGIFSLPEADLNGDNETNAVDIQLVINAVLAQ